MQAGESFTSIDPTATFLRPVWQSRLRAHAWAAHRGRTLSHYRCDIRREDDKMVAKHRQRRDDAARGRWTGR